jgi:opacity protein-like surface antigen
MKKIFLTAAFAVAVASPALAATHHAQRMNATTQDSTTQGSWAYASQSQDDVYVDGQWVGRDPDPSIRLGLLRQGDPSVQGGN